MITPAQRAEIRRLYFGEHWKVGTIAAALGVHHETVRAALQHETGGTRRGVSRPSALDPFLPFIRDTLTQYPRLRATRLHEMLRQRGYPGSAVQVRRLVRRLRPQATTHVYRRVVTLAGEQAQVDWGTFGKVRIGHGVRAVSGFVMVLGYSRALFALFTLDQTLESFLRGHVAAFEALGGSARTLVYDNLRSAVLDRRGTAIQFHPRLLELAGHYHFAPRPCTPARGNEKGKVERQIQYLRHAFFAARPFRDLDDLNAQFRRWRDDIAHQRRHPEQRDRPVAAVLAEEQPRLLPLPVHPFETDVMRAVRSGKTPYVRFDRNQYSIPHTQVRRPLTLVANATTVRVLDGQTELARHRRSYDTGQTIEDAAHLEGLLAATHQANVHTARDRLRVAVPATAALFDRLAARGEALRPHTSAPPGPARRLRVAGARRGDRHGPRARCPRRRLDRSPAGNPPAPAGSHAAPPAGLTQPGPASAILTSGPIAWRVTMPSPPVPTTLMNDLRRLGLLRTAEDLNDILARATRLRWSPTVLLEHIVTAELEERQRRSIERRLTAARLGRFKPIADWDWNWPTALDRPALERVLALDFLDRAENVILVGAQGLGKTMLAKNIVHQVVLAGHSARFITASDLLLDLNGQETARALERRLRHYVRPALLAIDEIGYLAYDAHAADLLFQIVSRRYEHRPLLMTTNLAFKHWDTIFPNASCAVALIDRLTHHAEIVVIEGDSYRKREAELSQKQRRTKPKRR